MGSDQFVCPPDLEAARIFYVVSKYEKQPIKSLLMEKFVTVKLSTAEQLIASKLQSSIDSFKEKFNELEIDTISLN